MSTRYKLYSTKRERIYHRTTMNRLMDTGNALDKLYEPEIGYTL